MKKAIGFLIVLMLTAHGSEKCYQHETYRGVLEHWEAIDSAVFYIQPHPDSAWDGPYDCSDDTISSNDSVEVFEYTPTQAGLHALYFQINPDGNEYFTFGTLFVEEPVSGVGDYLCSLYVLDTEGAAVRGRPQVYSLDRSTPYVRSRTADADGLLEASLDSGSYRVELNENGYSQLVDTLAVLGASANDTFTLSAFSVTAPSDTGDCRVYVYVYEITGAKEAAKVTLDPITRGERWTHIDSTKTYIPKSVTFRTDSVGYGEQDIPRSDYITNEDGDSLKYNVTITATNNSFTWKKNKVAFTDSTYQLR